MPYKIPRDSCCKHLESPYWKTVEKRLAESSDAPKRNGNELYCLSLKKVILSNFEFKKYYLLYTGAIIECIHIVSICFRF